MNKSTKIILSILIVLVAAGLIVAVIAKKNKKSNQPEPIKYGQKVDAPAGQLAQGFLADLIIDSSSKPDFSFYAPLDQNTTQYTAQFATKDSISTSYNAYLKYFQANKDAIISKTLKDKSAVILAAAKNMKINVTITNNTGTTQVYVSYYLIKSTTPTVKAPSQSTVPAK